jgi:hypothetical protein
MRLAAHRQWKALNAISFAIGRQLRLRRAVRPKDVRQAGEHVSGTIARDGTITMASRDAAGPPNCPICLARDTAILAPDGPIAVEELHVGTVVWTLDAAGRHTVGTVLAVASTPVPRTHRVVRLLLSDGRSVVASPGHPLADGRVLGSLRAGDRVDGARVVSARRAAYAGGRTFDLVVSGPTGIYLAGDGIPLASTLDR